MSIHFVSVCIYWLDSQNALLKLFLKSAGQLCNTISAMSFRYLSTHMLIMGIICTSFHQADTDSSSIQACNIHSFPLSLPLLLCKHGPTGTKMAISPLLLQSWSAWKLVHLVFSSLYAFKCTSDVYLIPPANHNERRQTKIKCFHYFLPDLETSLLDFYSTACGRRTPIDSRNPVFVPSVCCCPFFPLAYPLSKDWQHSKHPFVLYCGASWQPPSCLGWWDKKKEGREYKGSIKRAEVWFSSVLL